MTRRSLLFGSLGLALRQDKVDAAVKLIEDKIASGEVSAAALEVRCRGKIIRRGFGAAKTADAVFLLASITKPMTATAVMVLADRGQLALSDPVQKFLPEFKGGERDRVRILHLLTHTSGLPDMLPNNEELRKRHAPLSDFIAEACRTPLLFTPGTQVKYQSMGILLASEIVTRISRRPLRDFLRENVFARLGMRQTSLGLGGRKISATMLCQVPEKTDWDWNSPYWRNLGAPWGGAHSTVGDLSRFLHYFAQPDASVLKPATAALMITDQNQGLPESWGIGWMLKGPQFGKGCSTRTFGHLGSTGTMAWMEPGKDLSFVLLTTEPLAASEKALLKPASDLVSEAA